jgi:membrane-associated phospholipid phosphatase
MSRPPQGSIVPMIEPDSGEFRWSRRRKLLCFGLCLIAASQLDLRIAAYFRTDPCGRTIRDLLEVAEAFGHAIGVVFILTAVSLLDPARRRVVPALAAASLGAGIVADLVKLAVPRYRPRAHPRGVASVWDTFEGPFSSLPWQDSLQSFPSAHTSVAFGLAFGLSHQYPRGRRLFFTLAVLCGIHRLQSQAHHLPDVVCGVLLGATVATLLREVPWLRRSLDDAGCWFERLLAGRQSDVESAHDESPHVTDGSDKSSPLSLRRVS